MKKILCGFIFSLILSGCGQNGSLYRPTENHVVGKNGVETKAHGK